ISDPKCSFLWHYVRVEDYYWLPENHLFGTFFLLFSSVTMFLYGRYDRPKHLKILRIVHSLMQLFTCWFVYFGVWGFFQVTSDEIKWEPNVPNSKYTLSFSFAIIGMLACYFSAAAFLLNHIYEIMKDFILKQQIYRNG